MSIKAGPMANRQCNGPARADEVSDCFEFADRYGRPIESPGIVPLARSWRTSPTVASEKGRM